MQKSYINPQFQSDNHIKQTLEKSIDTNVLLMLVTWHSYTILYVNS